MTKEDGEELMRLQTYLKQLVDNRHHWARTEEIKIENQLMELHKRLSERREVTAWIA